MRKRNRYLQPLTQAETFGHFVDRLSEFGLAYMQVIKGETGGSRDIPGVDYTNLRYRFGGSYVATTTTRANS